MDQGQNNIRQGIEDTRAALDDKLNTLESKAQDTLDRARETLDVRSQVAERPWLALGAAVAAGYVLGSMGGDSESRHHGQFDLTETKRFSRSQPRPFEVQSLDDLRSRRQGSGSSQPSRQERSHEERGLDDARRSTPAMLSHSRQQPAGGGLVAEFEEEINMLKDAAMSTLRSLLRETVRSYVPALSDQIDKMGNESAPQRGPGVSAQRRDATEQQREVGGSPAYGGTELPESARKTYSSL